MGFGEIDGTERVRPAEGKEAGRLNAGEEARVTSDDAMVQHKGPSR